MSQLDVICVGSATDDVIASVARMPRADERVVATSFLGAGGGPAATAAVALARLGASVGFCGVVGDDDAGLRVRASLEREGVDVRWLTMVPGSRTAQSSIIVSGESRAIVAWPAAEPAAADIPVDASRWLHVDQSGFAPVRAALSGVTDVRPRLSVDAGNPLPPGDLADVDLFVPSVSSLLTRYPASAGREAAITAALTDGARVVVATDGSGGAYLRGGDSSAADADASICVEGFDVPVVSTLGAGDVFHGALLAALVAGDALPQAVRSANAVAALSCRALDGRSAIPRRDELADFLNAHGGVAVPMTVTT
ncbi:carbohydrate kinase family protein [Herbiconiux daphne]|uniref:PfkB family carbohydrate kinase n=1 Tax=Herbiconiux daphne TaxID=2970914 RepID=A0ABT2GX40_9MICO|nr:PfkB family carbohydrate kinase [Herbiconiux daphne]MCS5732515.1 PfkB family carbohydrate kinase [Herbiconiux daphne]